MAKNPKWLQKIIDEVPLLSNKELIEAALNQAKGDDYDGSFTHKGECEYAVVKDELNKRLLNFGFIQTPLYMEEKKIEPNEITKITAPFTTEQVKALDEWQFGEGILHPTMGIKIPFHPFTCDRNAGCEKDKYDGEGVLIPIVGEGWVCPCGKYKQNWAHSFMAEKR